MRRRARRIVSRVDGDGPSSEDEGARGTRARDLIRFDFFEIQTEPIASRRVSFVPFVRARG